MSSASSHQSFVRDGAGYEEVYPSGHENHDSQSEERSPSASSSSSRNEFSPLWVLMDLGSSSCYLSGVEV